MLADELIAGEQLRHALGATQHSAFSNALRGAQRFSLSKEFASAATHISHTNISSFANCMTACRSPAQSCWLEVPNSFRTDFMNDNDWIVGERYWARTTRVGILIECDSPDCTEYSVTLAFRLDNGMVCISTISSDVNLSGMDKLPDWHDRAARYLYEQKFSGKELNDALIVESRCLASPCKFASEVIARMKVSIR